MSHNPDDFPTPDAGDEVPGFDSDGGTVLPFGAEDTFTEVPEASHDTTGTCMPGTRKENDDFPQFDVPGAIFMDPPDIDQS